MSTMNVQTLKGFRDFLPDEAIKRNYLKDKIRQVFENWGYSPLETPTLEYLELFAGQIGEDEKLFFQFEDRGGRKVALRYDQTVPSCRVVGQYQNELTFPFKRYQIQSAFRAENPQKGRYREFLQCDADIWGVPTSSADAEVIALSLAVYKEIGFPKVIARINDRKLLADIPYVAIVALDKLQKIGKDGVIAEMVKRGIDQSQAQIYFDQVINLKPNDTIKEIFETLENLGFSKDWYVFDPTIARSFAYSDGPIWEIEVPGYTAGSVLGGERFDGLTLKVTGRDIPATGFAVGFDRTLEAAEQFGLLPETKSVSKILITVFSKELEQQSMKLCATLRSSHLNTEIYIGENAKMEKQLKYADNKGIPFVAIIGPEEVAKNVIVLKNMKTREQKALTLDDVVKILNT